MDFTDIEKIIFTIKNSDDLKTPVIVEKVFKEPGFYEVIITPSESLKLKEGALFDFNQVLKDGTRYKISNTGKIILRKGVGEFYD